MASSSIGSAVARRPTQRTVRSVHRTILLSSNGNTAAGPVRTTRYTANGAIVMELCGSASSTRL